MNDEIIKKAKELLEIQGSDGNWNYDEYMHGMYNGMELILALFEGRDPVYKDHPEKWTVDKILEEIGSEG